MVLSVVSYAQDQHRTCGMEQRMQEKLADPVFAQEYQVLQQNFETELLKVKAAKLAPQLAQAPQATLVIPVAVHFPGGNNADRACLVALAQSQIDVLNQDFTATNTDISNWTPAVQAIYASTNTDKGALDVQFVIGTLNHPANTDPNLVEGEPAVTVGYNFGGGADADIKWAGYKNFLIKDAGNGILGYSPLAGSIAAGAAVVMSPAAFGSDAIAPGCTSNGIAYVPGAPYNLGRTTTHELGHFFNLDHTFNGGCTAPGDSVADTPAVAAPTYGTPATGSVDGCVAGQKALTMNYMDYVNDSHMWMLSKEQEDRVNAYLATQTFLTNVYNLTPDYSITATNSPIAVCNSATNAVFNYNFGVINGYSANTTLAVTTPSPLPAGVNAVISQTSFTGAGSFTLTVTGLTNLPAGDNTITITATGTTTKTVDVVLNVAAGVTAAPSLTAPANNATGLALPSATLTWAAVTGVTTYTVETATDNAFTANTTSNSVSTLTYNFGGLAAGTDYFWRVKTTNICGDSTYSSVFKFTTVFDTDGDGVLDGVDNCVNTANPDQADVDGNGVGDACQDTDSDTVLDINDNCPTVANTDQADVDGNGIGDLCQDTDADGVLDINDNCPLTANTDQADANNDGVGDVCESIEPADTLTPNGDLQNDTWNIKNIEYVNNNTVKVFNRHGVKVFDASNYVNNTWGGESTEGGSGLLPAGSYYYVIEYTSTQGEAKVTKGWMYINY